MTELCRELTISKAPLMTPARTFEYQRPPFPFASLSAFFFPTWLWLVGFINASLGNSTNSANGFSSNCKWNSRGWDCWLGEGESEFEEEVVGSWGPLRLGLEVEDGSGWMTVGVMFKKVLKPIWVWKNWKRRGDIELQKIRIHLQLGFYRQDGKSIYANSHIALSHFVQLSHPILNQASSLSQSLSPC